MSSKQLFEQFLDGVARMARERQAGGNSYTSYEREADIWVELLNRNSRSSDKYVVELTNYYLGESGGAGLQSAILQRGRRMVPLLRNAIAKGIRCEKRFEVACLPQTANEQQKSRMLDLIREIESR